MTWSSFFNADRILSVEEVPIDEAFFANSEGFDALRLQIKLMNPAPGSLSADWDKSLVFSTAFLRLELRQADGLHLAIVVLQYQFRNALGHFL